MLVSLSCSSDWKNRSTSSCGSGGGGGGFGGGGFGAGTLFFGTGVAVTVAGLAPPVTLLLLVAAVVDLASVCVGALFAAAEKAQKL